MHTATLRRAGGSLILTVPQAYAEQNKLTAGSKVEININGDALSLKPVKNRPPRRSLDELLAQTPEDHRVHGWNEMPAVGLEIVPPYEPHTKAGV